MRFQEEDFDCGPASLVNIAAAFGRKVSLARAGKVAGTTESGTDEKGMLRGLSKLGFEGTEFQTSIQSEAMSWLKGQLLLGYPTILVVEKNDHWAIAAGLLGDRIVYIDSADYEQNKRENGIYVYSQRKVANLWKARWEGRRIPCYYGISVRKKDR